MANFVVETMCPTSSAEDVDGPTTSEGSQVKIELTNVDGNCF